MSVRLCGPLACVGIVLLAGGSLRGQSVTQTVQGRVTDATGAVIQGASLTLTNLATGVLIETQTNETGNYTFTLVPVGSYRIVCKAASFKQGIANNVRVETAGQARQDFRLEIGDVSERIEVQAPAVALQTENPNLGSVVGNRSVVELPLEGRNIVKLAVLTPGVQFGNKTNLTNGGGGFPVPGQAFSVSANGIREMHQVFSLDGVDAKDPRMHRANFVPSIEAIEEFKIQTNSYSAEIGFGGGAVINVTMKSGGNELHGTLFQFLRNDALDAEDYFLNLNLAQEEERRPKDRLRRNQFGFVAAGPIVKNKIFWALNWESRIERKQFPAEGWYPLDEFRAGDFSELLTGTINPDTGQLFRAPIAIYDPFTGEPFPQNQIPTSRFHAGIVNSVLADYMPRASFRQIDPLGITDRRGVDEGLDSNQGYARIDHHFRDIDRVFGRIALVRSRVDRAVMNPNFFGGIESRQYNIASQWIHTFGANLINELRLGYNTTIDFSGSTHTNDDSFDVDELGIGQYRVVFDGNRKLRPLEQGLPSMRSLPNDRWPRFWDGQGSDDRADSYQLGNHLSWMTGNHNIKIGYELYRISMRRQAGAGADIRFSAAETSFDFAGLLMGIPSRTATPIGWPPTYPRANRHGVYIQDDWKLMPKLTMNVGLRFDYNGNTRDSRGLLRTLDFPGDGTDAGRGTGYQTEDGSWIPVLYPARVDETGAVKLWKQDVRFFMPRVGLAYRLNPKTVIRAGTGYFDNIMHQNTFTILNLQPPKSGSQLFAQRTASAGQVPVTAIDGSVHSVSTRRFVAGTPPITMDDPYLTQVGGAPVPRPVPTLHIQPDYKDGDVWKWSFDVQRELPSSTALTVGYVGSKGSHVGNSITQWNEAAPSPGNNPQARRPYRWFYDPALPDLGVQDLGRIRYLDSYGNSFHHGLQLKLDRRYKKGFTFGFAYTLSKSHGDGEAGGQEGAAYQFPLTDRKDARARYRFDQRHNLVGRFVWELPGKDLSGFWKHLFGHWQANGIISIRSGLPFSALQAAADLNLNRDSSRIRPDRLAEGSLASPSRAQWFDTNAFGRVTCRLPDRQDLCRFGSSGLNILNRPSQRNFDLSLYKNIPLRERFRLQLRAELFNAFNTPYFGQPEALRYEGSSLVPNGPQNGEIRELASPMRIVQFGLKLTF